MSQSSLFRVSRQFALPLWRWYLAGIAALGVTNYIMLEIPRLSKDIVNGMMGSQDHASLRTIAVSIILLGILQMVIRTLSRILLFWPGRVLEKNVKDFYFDRFLKLPQIFFERFGMGDLISRLSNDIGQLRAFFAFALLQFLNLIYLTVMTITRMTSIHWQLTLFSLLPLGLMIFITRVGIPRMHRYSKLNQEAIGRLTNRVTEAFVNIHVIQVNSAKDSFVSRIQSENQSVYQTNMKLVLIRMIIFPLMSLLGGFSFLVVLYYGGLEVTRGNLTIGDILAFNVYIGMLTFPLAALGFVIAIYQRAKTASDRLTELETVDIERALMPKPNTADSSLKDTAARNEYSEDPDTNIPMLEIRNLSFSFPIKSQLNSEASLEKSNHSTSDGASKVSGGAEEPEESPQILKGISLVIQKGERIGICGRVGSGKTTLFNLITRIYDPPVGTVFVDGVDVLEIDPLDLRRKIGYAMQTVHLFSDTIIGNLRFGTTVSEDDPRVKACARDAQIYDEIESFPKKWLTEIGEKGVRLSGGQKQRLALARIFLREPEAFLLDDVTSALDHSTEQKIISHIHKMQKTVLISSHRSSALQSCDRIFIFDAGMVIAEGTMSELELSHQEAFLAE